MYADHQVAATITGVSAVPVPVPEPERQGWALLMAGLFIVGSLTRRRASRG